MQTRIVPVISYNYAARNIDRCKKTLSTAILFGLALMALGTLCFNTIPTQMLKVFTKDAQVIEIGRIGFHFVDVSFLPMVTSLIFPVFFQAVGASLKSSALTVIRTVLLSKPGAIITIAREHGSSGKQIGKIVAQKLGIPFYYKEMVALTAHESGLDKEFISDIHKNAPDALRDLYLSSHAVQRAMRAQANIIRKIADNGSCVIVGRAADYVLRNYKNVVRVFIHAPEEHRIGRVMEVYGDTLSEAKRNIRRSDKARASYYRHISGKRWGDAGNYELVVDSSIGVERSAELILDYVSAASGVIG